MLDRPDAAPSTPWQFIPPDEQGHVTIAAIIAFVSAHLRLLTGFVIGNVVLGLIYCLLTTPYYTARAQILIDQQAQNFSDSGRDERIFLIDSATMESQITLLHSERILSAVISTLKLNSDPELCAREPSILTRLLSYFRSTPNKEVAEFELQRCTMMRLQDNLTTRRVLTSYAIDISYSSANPAKAASIANAIADAYVRDQMDTRSDNARQASIWLQGRIDELRVQMNVATQAVQEFKAKRDYRILQPREPATGREAEAGNGTNAETPAKQRPGMSTLEELETTAKTYLKMYESYLGAFAQTVQKQSYHGSNARVITEATRPLERSHPRTGLIIVFCGLLGTLLGIGAAITQVRFGGYFSWPQFPFRKSFQVLG